MGSSLTLDAATLAVTPGEAATCEVRVRNTGAVVDQIRLRAIGPVADWMTIEPALLNLFPDEEGSALVTFRPPRSAEVAAGSSPFAVRADSREAPDWSEVTEGSVDVAPFTDTEAWLSPRTAQGSRRARYRLHIDNRGNRPLDAEIAVVDVDDQLTFDLGARRVVTEPGTVSVVKVRAKARKTFARGPDQSHPFQVLVRTGLDEPVTAEGAMTQRQLLPAWLVPLLAMLAAGAIVLAVLWLTVLRPVVKSAARAEAQSEALAEEVREVKAEAEQAGQDASQAKQAVGLGGATPKPSAQAGAGGPGGADDPGGLGGLGSASGGTPFDFRIGADAAVAGGFQTAAYTVPPGGTVLVTDIVLQNPRGDSGLLRIQRGQTVLIETGLENFRDLDYHFVEPLAFSAGQRVTLAVDCTNGTGTACTPAVYFSGQLRKAASPSPSPTAP